ncbi:S-adenosylmethionine decarboxylase family protein [Rhizobacter sp. LjRoot28]|jgi:S-adenosylmethionine decarboxylase|uniref:S-adenosylmethionine decarboxylase family protein n=1 Tax=Rhizobacter sp. LjRoot28 TaxID=3342309 RepID=UPI003ECE97CE
MNGLHLTADLRDCDPAMPAMTDVAALRGACLAAVAGAGLTAVGELFHRFPGAAGTAPDQGGATGVVLLAESHVAVHTWPELHAVTLDVYVCNFGADNTARAHTLMTQLEACFSPGRIERHALQRGAA